MPNKNAQKGSRWETAVKDYLAELFGRAAFRPRQAGYKDVGDIHLDPFVLQAKDTASHDLSGWVREVEAQRVAAGARFGVVVVKKRRSGTSDGYVVMSLGTFRNIVGIVRAKTPRPDDTPEPDTITTALHDGTVLAEYEETP